MHHKQPKCTTALSEICGEQGGISRPPEWCHLTATQSSHPFRSYQSALHSAELGKAHGASWMRLCPHWAPARVRCDHVQDRPKTSTSSPLQPCACCHFFLKERNNCFMCVRDRRLRTSDLNALDSAWETRIRWIYVFSGWRGKKKPHDCLNFS